MVNVTLYFRGGRVVHIKGEKFSNYTDSKTVGWRLAVDGHDIASVNSHQPNVFDKNNIQFYNAQPRSGLEHFLGQEFKENSAEYRFIDKIIVSVIID